MLQIGILGNEGSWYVAQLAATAASRGHKTTELRFPQQRAAIVGNQVALHSGECNIAALDVLIVRTMPPGSLEQVVSRMDFLLQAEALGIRVVNSPRAVECAVDKSLTTIKLATAGIPVPDTIVCEDSESALDAFEKLGGNVVVKPLFGAEGRGILRIDQPELALRTFRTLERIGAVLYVQRYIEGSGSDIRLLVLAGKVIAAMKRSPAAGDFRANVSQSGSAEAIEPTDEWCALAIQAAEVTGCDFCGVDLMLTESDQPLVIEVNAVPGWRAIQRVTGIDVAAAFLGWLEGQA